MFPLNNRPRVLNQNFYMAQIAAPQKRPDGGGKVFLIKDSIVEIRTQYA